MSQFIALYLMVIIMSLNQLPLFAAGEESILLENIPFKIDVELEKLPAGSAERCFCEFIDKGGKLEKIASLMNEVEVKIRFLKGDAIYPICSGGWCRSQTLWAILYPYSNHFVLFPPHAARLGWDPYNGQINRCRNYGKENLQDEFSNCFEREKTMRFGFENDQEWELVERDPTSEGMMKISQYYDRHFFGPGSTWEGKQGKRRIYIAFAQNVHIVLYRLIQNNDNLDNVTVVAINSEDIISDPPISLNTTSRSKKAYAHFADLLSRVFDFSEF